MRKAIPILMAMLLGAAWPGSGRSAGPATDSLARSAREAITAD